MLSRPHGKMPLFVGLFLVVLAGCTSPTGTTKDSFEMTSSTSGHSWYSEDGTVKDTYRLIAFTTLNFTVLKQDMARGDGEYLSSLGTLMGVPTIQRTEFETLVQNRYARLVPSAKTTPTEMLASLAQMLAPPASSSR